MITVIGGYYFMCTQCVRYKEYIIINLEPLIYEAVRNTHSKDVSGYTVELWESRSEFPVTQWVV